MSPSVASTRRAQRVVFVSLLCSLGCAQRDHLLTRQSSRDTQPTNPIAANPAVSSHQTLQSTSDTSLNLAPVPPSYHTSDASIHSASNFETPTAPTSLSSHPVDLATNTPQSVPVDITLPASYDTATDPTSFDNRESPALPTMMVTAAVASELQAQSSNLSSASQPASEIAESPAHQPNLRVTVHNVLKDRGVIRLALFTDPSAFPLAERADLTTSLPASDSRVTTEINISGQSLAHATERSAGQIAVATYQDINGDGELNRNRFGIPTEPFAFSRGALGRRGPPSFQDAAVPLTHGKESQFTHIELTLLTQAPR